MSGGTTRRGASRRDRAVELPGADPGALARALAGEGDRTVPSDCGPVSVEAGEEFSVEVDEELSVEDGETFGPGSGGPAAIRIRTPEPGPLHDRVNPIVPGTSVTVRAALAAAARTRGIGAPQDEAIRETRADLAGIDPESVDLAAVRRRVAEAGDRESELAERVAELRGRVRARDGAGRDADEAREELSAAAADLAEARTERIAAEQALDRARAAARRARDRRERRLELEDRLGNLRRGARAHLAGEFWAEFRAALDAVPGEGSVGDEPGSYEGDPLTAALAVVRVADLDVPVVVATDRFPDVRSAAEALDAPVIRV